MNKKILITGVSGHLGGMLFKAMAKIGYSNLVGTDLKKKYITKNEKFILADLKNFKSILKITKAVNTIVHFGAIPIEDSKKNILHNNIIGTYNLFEAARINKVKRIIFASSNHAIGFHRRKTRLNDFLIKRPDSHYGLSKAFGEDLSRFYADKFNIQSMCIRIGSCLRVPKDRRHLSTWISYNDLVQLVDIGVKHKSIHNEIVYGVSKNKKSWWNNSRAYKLGYRPKDSADKFNINSLSKNEYKDKMALIFQGGVFTSANFKGNIKSIK
ncbi:NAD(P)-dependent oxidoreductase [Pelagibacteraceae bacterium]|jgi:uronate dehydrogenase|nr:NAD(P)-dependent oxidoreductase [Pelagibacteraceae bacterium]